MEGQQRVSTLHLLLILIRNLLVEQDSLGEARQLETLLDALMNDKTYEVVPGDPPSVRNLRDRYGDLEEPALADSRAAGKRTDLPRLYILYNL